MRSIGNLMLQEETLYGVNKKSYVTGIPLHGIHKDFFLTRRDKYGVNKDLPLTTMHFIWGQLGLFC
jgi:hypothetical protein